MKKVIWIVIGFGLLLAVGKSKANSGTNLVGSFFDNAKKDNAIQNVINTQLKGATEGDARFCGDLYYINRDKGPEAAKAQSFAAAKLWAKPSTPESDNYQLYDYPNIEKWFTIKNGVPTDPSKDKPVNLSNVLGLINSVTNPSAPLMNVLGTITKV